MLFADNAGVISLSSQSLAKAMADIVVMYAAFDLTVAESKTKTVHLREPKDTAELLTIKTACQRYQQTNKFVYPRGTIHSTDNTMAEFMRRSGLAHLYFHKYGQVYDCPKIPRFAYSRQMYSRSCCTTAPRGCSSTQTTLT